MKDICHVLKLVDRWIQIQDNLQKVEYENRVIVCDRTTKKPSAAISDQEASVEPLAGVLQFFPPSLVLQMHLK